MFPRNKNEIRSRLESPGLGLGVVSILIVHFGLLFWILMTFSVVPLNFSQLRGIWKQSELAGPTVFQIFILIAALLLILVVVDAWATKRRETKFRWFRAIGYVLCVVVLGFIGRNLYEFAQIPLNDEWYYSQLKNEPSDTHWIELGRVLERDVLGCADSEKECVLVELASGTTANALVSPEIFGAPSSIVAMEGMVGRYSGKEFLQIYSYVPVEDAELFWRSEVRKRGKRNGT